jgi:hypothetical protein
MAETTVKRLLCCRFRRTGKAMREVYQCSCRICREINVFSRLEYHTFYVLYPFVTYLLTLPRIKLCVQIWNQHIKFIKTIIFTLPQVCGLAQLVFTRTSTRIWRLLLYFSVRPRECRKYISTLAAAVLFLTRFTFISTRLSCTLTKFSEIQETMDLFYQCL